MRFGLGQFTLQIPPWDDRSHEQLYADTLALAELADKGGFSSFWLAEHHGAGDGYNPALLPFLSAVAARTRRLEVGTAVLLAPFHDPLRVAEDAAVVDNIAGGRLNLGLGLGWAPEEYRMFGVDTKRRGKRLDEFVEVLRRAWTQERFSFDGEFLTYDDVAITPKPAPLRASGVELPHPPIFLGGNVEPALRRAALRGDGYFPPSVTGGPDALVARAKELVALREELGVERPFRYGAFVPVGIGADADEAWAKIRDGVLHVRGAYLMWAQNQRDVSKAVEGMAAFEQQVRDGCIVGTPAQVIEQLKPMADALDGLGLADVFVSVILAPPGMQPGVAREQVERFAGDIIPAVTG